MYWKIYFCLVCGIILGSCKTEIESLRPVGFPPVNTVEFTKGDLTTTLVDNSAFGDRHKAGYNGIAELRHTALDSNLFVPDYAGFNLEHIFDGDSLEELFEPRKNPMELFKVGENKAALYQAPTPISNLGSLTEFTLVDPHYIDIEFSFIVHSKEFFNHGYTGIFWASYINAPPDKNIYFWGKNKFADEMEWISAYSKRHGSQSSHKWIDDKMNTYFASNFNVTLANHFSDFVFQWPVYFGSYHNMAFAYFFENAEGIRFAQSPTGGGPTNPAWDFQYIIEQPKVGHQYSFKCRLLYKPYVSGEDILQEYRLWIEQLAKG